MRATLPPKHETEAWDGDAEDREGVCGTDDSRLRCAHDEHGGVGADLKALAGSCD